MPPTPTPAATTISIRNLSETRILCPHLLNQMLWVGWGGIWVQVSPNSKFKFSDFPWEA